MKTQKLSLDIFTKCLEERGFEVKFYYDRVKLYVDSTVQNRVLNNIKSCGGEQKIESRALMHYDIMNRLIDVRQPGIQYFEELKSALTGDYLLNYVEFAMDIISDNKINVRKLRRLLNELWVFERKRCDLRFYHGIMNKTHYFGRRYHHKDVLAIYSDRKSKVAKGKYCVHIEMRYTGSKMLKDLGIYTVQDLIDFDHEKLWDKLIDLRDAHYTELGRLLFEEESGLSDSTLSRYSKHFLNTFVGLQDLLMKNPGFAGAFPSIKNRRMFESRLNQVLGL